MSLFSSLRNRSHSKAADRNSDVRCSRRRTGFLPRLDHLESRVVLSTLHVTNNLDNTDPGSLREQIAEAQSGDTIMFDSTVTGTIKLIQGELQIKKNLTIQGPGATDLTISGGGSAGSRVFEIDGATTTVTLSGFSLMNGSGLFYPYTLGTGIGWSGGGHTGGTGTASDGQGGAIWNGGVLTVSDCTLTNNSVDANPVYSIGAFSGGAIYNAGTLTLSGSTVQNNAAGDFYAGNGGYGGNGGAIYNTGTLIVSTNSELSYNTAYGSASSAGSKTGLGGAIENAGTLSVTNSRISNNTAYWGAGVFSGYKLTATITGTTFSYNSAFDGGAIWNDGTMTLSASFLGANTATDAGGGIFNSKEGHLTLQSATRIIGNTAPVGADLDSFGSVKLSKDSTVG